LFSFFSDWIRNMEKSSKKNKIPPESNHLPSLKEIQFSDSIKHKLYSVSNGEKKKTDSSQTQIQNKTSYVDKYKAKKVLVKVQEPTAKHSSLNININSDPLKLHNSSQISFAASNGKSKKSKKGILKKSSKKVKFIKNDDFEKKILKNQENTKLFNSDFHAVDKIKEKKTDFFDEDYEEFVMSIDSESDENDENVVSIGLNQEDHYEYSFHTRRYHIPSPRYTMLINEIEYYKHKVYLLQQENSNMHLKISILEDKLMTKANNNNNSKYKGKVLVIHEDKELDENVNTEFSNESRLKKKPSKQKKSLIEDTLPPTTLPQASNHVSEKKNENFVENYEIFMKNLQKKINETETAIENETSNVNNDNNTQIEQMNISYLFKTPTSSGNQKGSRKSSPLVFTNNEAIVETPRRDSPSNKAFTKQVNNKTVGELSKTNSSLKLPVLLKSKPQLVTASYTYEDIQNEELEELKKKINDDLFF
jgi:hypothetical protein